MSVQAFAEAQPVSLLQFERVKALPQMERRKRIVRAIAAYDTA
jgi:hypothetical protein